MPIEPDSASASMVRPECCCPGSPDSQDAQNKADARITRSNRWMARNLQDQARTARRTTNAAYWFTEWHFEIAYTFDYKMKNGLDRSIFVMVGNVAAAQYPKQIPEEKW